MNKTATVRARMEPGKKLQAEAILAELGMTPTDAIGMFYTQVVFRGGLPFDVKIPNVTTLAAIQDADNGVGLEGYENVDDMFGDILNGVDAKDN